MATGLVPAQYGPDTLENYEIGLKSEWFDNRLVLNVSAFLMEWTDIQINTDAPGEDVPWWLRGTFNGETGESRGAEISFEWQATENLSLRRQRCFRERRVYSRYIIDPDPEATRFSRTARTCRTRPTKSTGSRSSTPCPSILGGDLWFRYDTSYQGESWTDLDAALIEDPEGLVPSWKSSNLQAGLTLDSGWDISLMARNVWDDRGVSNLYQYTYTSEWFDDPRFRNERTIQRPRTYGLSVTKRF